MKPSEIMIRKRPSLVVWRLLLPCLALSTGMSLAQTMKAEHKGKKNVLISPGWTSERDIKLLLIELGMGDQQSVRFTA